MRTVLSTSSSPPLALLLGLVCTASLAAPACGQEVQAPLAESGAFALRYPEAHTLLSEAEAGYTRLVAELTQRHPVAGGLLARLDAIGRGVDLLRIQILDIHSDPAISNQSEAVEAAIDRYLRNPGETLPARPKSMDLLHDHPLAGSLHTVAHHRLGESRAGVWLRLALFQPVLVVGEMEGVDARDGVATVVSRYLLKSGSPLSDFPSELPMAPTIAPDLTARYPRAAAIFDNLNLLRELVAEVLASGSTDAESRIGEAIRLFLDPSEGLTTHYEWVLMSLRHGIFHQGGPALGTLEGNERNEGPGHAGHAGHVGPQMILPGMGGMD